jgi:hypothetical protein
LGHAALGVNGFICLLALTIDDFRDFNATFSAQG